MGEPSSTHSHARHGDGRANGSLAADADREASHSDGDRDPRASHAHARGDGDRGASHGDEHGDAGHGHHHPGGPLAALRAIVAPHSHDTVDAIDTALESSAKGIRAVKISLVAMLATACAQVVLVLVTGSVALLADTIHNFGDALTAVPLWIAFVVGRRAATRRYTYGYGRSEDIAALFIVAMIAVSAVLAGWESMDRLVHPQAIGNVGILAIGGLIGFAGNELVALYRIRVGTDIGSAALVADGYHARTDGLTSLAVVIGALGVWLGYPAADPIVGLLITAVILWVLKNTVRQVFARLLDSVDPAVIDAIERVARCVGGVHEVDEVRARWNGHRLQASLQATIDCTISVSGGHAIGEEIRHRLLHEVRALEDVLVHVDPCPHDTFDPHAGTSHHVSRLTRSATSA